MPSKRKPAYQLHKATGQARVHINGKDHYLGEYGSPESRERYDDLIREWFARNGDTSRYTLTVDDLAVRFIEHARSYYRRKDGTQTSEVKSLQYAVRPVVQMFGRTRAREFGPLKLKEVRQSMIDAGSCRTHINHMVHRIRRMFAWGVENELIPPELLQALRAVPGLRAGRSEARESKPVLPVDEGTVNDTLPCLTPTVAAMVQSNS